MGLFSSVWNGIKKGAKAVGNVAKKSAGAIGTIAGGAVGGPAGAALGGSLGGAISSIGSKQGSPSRTSGISRTSQRVNLRPVSTAQRFGSGQRSGGRALRRSSKRSGNASRNRSNFGLSGGFDYNEDDGFSGGVRFGNNEDEERTRRAENVKDGLSAAAKYLPLAALGGGAIWLALSGGRR